MIFQWGPNTGIANFAHCCFCVGSQLQNSAPPSPLEWKFNGVQTLALLIWHIAVAVWVQNCKIPATITPGMIFQWGLNMANKHGQHKECEELAMFRHHWNIISGVIVAGILQFWTHTATAMWQINNASVWTPMNYHSSLGCGGRYFAILN